MRGYDSLWRDSFTACLAIVALCMFSLYNEFMFGEGVEIVPGMTVLHDDGLTYRVDKVVPSTDGYETAHRLSGLLRIAYTQMEDGGYPAGTEWNKGGEEFRQFFTPVPSPE